LCRNQQDISCRECFVTHVVLIYPEQPIAPECRRVLPHERFRAGVAGLCEQYSAKACGEIGGACGAFSQVSERIHATGASSNLDQYFRQIDAWHTRFDFLAQCDKGRWIFQLVQRTEYQFRFPGHSLKAHCLVLRKPSGNRTISCVQFLSQHRKRWLGEGA
jgi:hypothetical protein